VVEIGASLNVPAKKTLPTMSVASAAKRFNPVMFNGPHFENARSAPRAQDH
jgi:hypothetical protein